MTVVLTEGATAANPVAAVVHLDVNFGKRVEAMVRLWQSWTVRQSWVNGTVLRHYDASTCVSKAASA